MNWKLLKKIWDLIRGKKKDPDPVKPEPVEPDKPVSNRFLWKPVAEGGGPLVILLPNKYKGKVTGCHITDATGSIIEKGKFAGDVHNGERVHYRFSKHGAAYGQNLTVVAVLPDGDVTWHIPDGANRVEK